MIINSEKCNERPQLQYFYVKFVVCILDITIDIVGNVNAVDVSRCDGIYFDAFAGDVGVTVSVVCVVFIIIFTVMIAVFFVISVAIAVIVAFLTRSLEGLDRPPC